MENKQDQQVRLKAALASERLLFFAAKRKGNEYEAGFRRSGIRQIIREIECDGVAKEKSLRRAYSFFKKPDQSWKSACFPCRVKIEVGDDV